MFEINFIDQPDLVNYLNVQTEADEFQRCREIVTKIKFLVDEGCFKYVMSGSLLGIEMKGIASAPVGYLTDLRI